MSPASDVTPAVVVFDLGGVLAMPEELLPRLAAVAGVAAGPFEDAYWLDRAAYDAGGLDDAYWEPIVRAAGGVPTEALTAELTRADCEIWGTLPLPSRELLAELVAAGTRLGLLSNAPTAMARWVRSADWAQPFEHLVVSGEQGAMKPAAVVYELTTALFAVDPGEVLFFDDRADNVAGARAVGWDAHVWTGPADARTLLVDRGLLPGSTSIATAADRADPGAR